MDVTLRDNSITLDVLESAETVEELRAALANVAYCAPPDVVRMLAEQAITRLRCPAAAPEQTPKRRSRSIIH